MPKDLIPAGWVRTPCAFLLPVESPLAGECGECEAGFSLWKSRRHCMFCGYFFHRQCMRKIRVEGEFFGQRICSKCYYYRATAAERLNAGEDFECISTKGAGATVNISLSEETAELILHWKSKELKETADLIQVEVRKGFSHVNHHADVAGNYEPLRSFSLFLMDGVGEQYACHLKASSALSCHLWVEGLKAANYVYKRMLEQDQAKRTYFDRGKSTSSRWYRRLYLPMPAEASCSSDEEWEEISPNDDEWENIALPAGTSLACGFTCSTVVPPFSPTTPSPGSGRTTASSGYVSDLSMSLCSVPPNRQPFTVHSFNFSQSRTPSCSKKQQGSSSPPTPGLLYTPSPFSPVCRCHTSAKNFFQFQPSTSSQLSTAKCCEQCRNVCGLAADWDNL